MSAILPYGNSAIPKLPSLRAVKATRDITIAAEIERFRIQQEAALSDVRHQAVARTAVRALEAHAVICMTEQMVVNLEAGAIHGAAFLVQKSTLGLGRIIDNLTDAVTQ